MLEVPLVEIEETRFPGHGRRRRWRKDDFVVEDQRLIAIRSQKTLRSPADLLSLLPEHLPRPWHTGQLAESLGLRRHLAQRIAYCLRHMNAAREVGKRGNARLYDFMQRSRESSNLCQEAAARREPSGGVEDYASTAPSRMARAGSRHAAN